MYSSLQISGYRGLGTFTIDGLGRVNLLVGANNSGKTSILECIELLRAAGNPSVLTTILGRRGEWGTSSDDDPQGYLDVAHMFANRDLTETVIIEGNQADRPRRFPGWNRRVSIDVAYLHDEQLNLEDEDSLEEDGHVALRIKWSDPPQDLNIRLTSGGFLPWSSFRRLSRLRDAPNHSVQFIRTAGIQAADVIRLFGDVVLTEREEHVTEALRIIDQSIERIASVGIERRPLVREAPGGVFLKLSGIPQRVPIGSLGDGMWRMLGVALALANAKGGILLVDEIDTGLHYSVMEDMWRMVSERASALDVQVFATTHSRDCYESLAAVVAPSSKSPSVTIQRIDPSRGRAIGFSNDDIVAAAERGIEVR